MYSEKVNIDPVLLQQFIVARNEYNRSRLAMHKAEYAVHEQCSRPKGALAVIVKKNGRRLKAQVMTTSIISMGGPESRVRYEFQARGHRPREIHVFDGDTVIWEE